MRSRLVLVMNRGNPGKEKDRKNEWKLFCVLHFTRDFWEYFKYINRK